MVRPGYLGSVQINSSSEPLPGNTACLLLFSPKCGKHWEARGAARENVSMSTGANFKCAHNSLSVLVCGAGGTHSSGGWVAFERAQAAWAVLVAPLSFCSSKNSGSDCLWSTAAFKAAQGTNYSKGGAVVVSYWLLAALWTGVTLAKFLNKSWTLNKNKNHWEKRCPNGYNEVTSAIS